MAITSRLPNSESGTNGNEQLSNCIIASSDRFADLKPFCDSTYASDKPKWGSILPWEFPQNGTREVEEIFLRKFFTEVEIHMQGGAHGAGSGFRFLKQAWYSIAMRNLHHGIPAIAENWLKENVALLEDPAMRGHLCDPEVTPETFFGSHEIQQHGRKLLTLVVAVIQAQAKIRYEQPAQRNSSPGGQLLTTHVTRVSHGSEAEMRPKALVKPEPEACPDAAVASIKPLPIMFATAPIDPYATSFQGSTIQRSTHRGLRDLTPGYSQHTQQINGRKRDNQGSSQNFNRPLGNGRRQSDNHHQSFPNMHPAQGGFSSGTSPFVASVPGPTTAASSSAALSLYDAPSGPVYHAQSLRSSQQQQKFGPHPPPSGSVSQGMSSSNAFSNTPVQQFSQRRHFSNHSDNERVSNNRARNMSFNELSNTSGDARRTSFGSRGGGLRGQFHGGRGRGGRGRDSFHGTGLSSKEQPSISQASSEYYSKSGYSHGKRHSSAYHENALRSSSEQPQVENVLPYRVLSGPDQYPSFQDYHGSAGTRLLPPFIFPHGPAVKPPGPPVLHRPSQPVMALNPPEVPDYEVTKTYIGADAFFVDQLVVFNIPVNATEFDVGTMFARACDVHVSNVRFPNSTLRADTSFSYKDKIAIVSFRDHNVARRVLDLREVDLYGRPLHVEVPRRHLDENRLVSGKPSIPTHRNQGMHGLPPPGVNLWFHEPVNNSAQPPQQNMQMGTGAGFVQSSEARHYSYPPATPFHPAKGDQALSAVQSENATSVTSGPNTPKKSQSKAAKKNKKARNKTPLTSKVEGEKSTAPDKTTVHETPVKPPKQKRQDHSAPVGKVLPLATTSEDAKEVEPLQSPERSIDNGENAATSSIRPLYEIPLESQSQYLVTDCSLKATVASKDALATKPTSVPRKPSMAESESSPRDNPTAEQTRDHPQVCWSDMGSGITPKVSTRSQLPVHQSTELKPTPGRAAVPTLSERQSLPPPSSSPSSISNRPASVDRILLDSDHVDESFHTASASPPDDKQTQAKDVTAHSERPSHLSQLNSVRRTSDSPVSPVSSPEGNSVAPISPSISPKVGIPISIQNPTPSEIKARADSHIKDDKSRSPTPQHDASEKPEPVPAIQKSDDCHDETQALSAITVVRHADPVTPSLGHVSVRSDTSDKRSEEKSADVYQHRAISGSSVPPKSATSDQKARETSAPSQVSVSAHSPGNSSSKSKAPAKKGPSQTESLSMFGKKQKQKKPAKGKGTLKGKPLDTGSTSGLSDSISTRDRSGVASPVSTANESTTGRKASSLKATARLDSRANSGSNSDETKSAVSQQESPGKAGILGSLGGLSRVGNFFSMASSPTVSGHETMPQDAKPDGALMFSKAPVAAAPITSSIEDDPVDDVGTTPDLGGKLESGNSSGLYDGSLSTSTHGGSDVRKARKKKRERNRKQRKHKYEQRGESLNASTEGDSSNTVPGALQDETSESRDLDSDNRSDESSTTMGRPTPPVSPKRLSESKRRLVENRMTNSDHIITPPAPRNRHIKRKSYSRSASSATVNSTQEATPPTPAQPISETEIEQQNRILRVLQIANSDEDEDGSQQTRPRVLILSRSGENEGNRRFLTADDEGGRFKFIHFAQDDDGESDEVVLTSENVAMLSSTEAPVARILEEDSEDESNK